MGKEVKLGKVVLLEYGRHPNKKPWFSLFFNLGTFASFFCSFRTVAYDTAFQSGIGHVIRWPVLFSQYISILEYPTGTHITRHSDGDSTAHRSIVGININLVLKKAVRGGEFICPGAILNTSRLKIFNGDKYPHEVTPIEEGTRMLLAYKFSLLRKNI